MPQPRRSPQSQPRAAKPSGTRSGSSAARPPAPGTRAASRADYKAKLEGPRNPNARTGKPERSANGERPARGGGRTDRPVRGSSSRDDRPVRNRDDRPAREERPTRGGRPSSSDFANRGRDERPKRTRYSEAERPKRDESGREELPKRKGWGNVARRGAAVMKSGQGDASASEHEEKRRSVAPERSNEKWVQDSKPAPRRTTKKAEPSPTAGYQLPEEAIKELSQHVEKKQLERMTRYLKDAAKAYAAERWGDARKSLRIVIAHAPEAPIVQELNGMLYYRTGKWAQAIKELQLAHMASQTYDLYPAMMDAHRALKQYVKVEELWDELREASPDAEVMAEGRIVQAESLASQKKLTEAIALLEKHSKTRAKIQTHHLRTWYVLGDLYDKAGETSKARQHFERVAQHDPELGDVLGRLAALD